MIKLTQISKIYRTTEIETVALENINLEIRGGEFVSIMGPSGCGKSTLLNIAGILDEPTSGKVELDGKDVSSLGTKEAAAFRNCKLGFVFQSFHLIPSLNVIDNVQIPLMYRKGISQRQKKEMATAMIEKVGLIHRMKHFPSQLSGGQCQRVAIARALVGDPKIILADEPTGNLDSKMGSEIMSMLHQINKNDGKTILMVTHNEAQARQTDRIIRMMDGRIIE
ncbi:MAG TPA: ABC transporter ATP-binding protein [Candidatus Coprenecus stercoripullorum]|nr:ABC transporter ATP-binding protein [Candidatus Coprenecus stercoripullorum]